MYGGGCANAQMELNCQWKCENDGVFVTFCVPAGNLPYRLYYEGDINCLLRIDRRPNGDYVH